MIEKSSVITMSYDPGPYGRSHKVGLKPLSFVTSLLLEGIPQKFVGLLQGYVSHKTEWSHQVEILWMVADGGTCM